MRWKYALMRSFPEVEGVLPRFFLNTNMWPTGTAITLVLQKKDNIPEFACYGAAYAPYMMNILGVPWGLLLYYFNNTYYIPVSDLVSTNSNRYGA